MKNIIAALALAIMTGLIGFGLGYEAGGKDKSEKKSHLALYSVTLRVEDEEEVSITDTRFGWSDDFSPYVKGMPGSTITRNSDGTTSIAVIGLDLDADFELEVSALGYVSQTVIVEAQSSGILTRSENQVITVKLKKE